MKMHICGEAAQVAWVEFIAIHCVAASTVNFLLSCTPLPLISLLHGNSIASVVCFVDGKKFGMRLMNVVLECRILVS